MQPVLGHIYKSKGCFSLGRDTHKLEIPPSPLINPTHKSVKGRITFYYFGSRL